MSRFDLYRTAGGGLVVDVQSDILPEIGTRLVVPLLPSALAPPALPRLHPVLELEGKRFVMATHLMASLPLRAMGAPVGSVKSHYDEIVAAIDMIFIGF